MFTVELMRGPHGLGLALVDGMVRNIFVLFLYSTLVYSFYSVYVNFFVKCLCFAVMGI